MIPVLLCLATKKLILIFNYKIIEIISTVINITPSRYKYQHFAKCSEDLLLILKMLPTELKCSLSAV